MGVDQEVWRAYEFDIARALQRALTAYARRAAVFIGIFAILDLPGLLSPFSRGQHLGVVSALGWLAWGLIAHSIDAALIVTIAFADLNGAADDVDLAQAVTRVVPVAITALAMAIGIIVGATLVLIPGLILATMTSCAIPACVIEGLGPVRAIQRSFELTRGFRWNIFLAFAAPFFAELAVHFIRYALPAADGSFVSAQAVFDYASEVVFGAFGTVLAAVIYHDIRAGKETAPGP